MASCRTSGKPGLTRQGLEKYSYGSWLKVEPEPNTGAPTTMSGALGHKVFPLSKSPSKCLTHGGCVHNGHEKGGLSQHGAVEKVSILGDESTNQLMKTCIGKKDSWRLEVGSLHSTSLQPEIDTHKL